MQQERMGSEQADQALAEAIKHKKFRTHHRSRQKGRGLAELRDLVLVGGFSELRSLAPHERQQRQYGIGGNSSSSARLAIISGGPAVCV